MLKFILIVGIVFASSIEFKSTKIKVKNIPLLVEIAETPDQHQRGLMFRKSLKEGEGMLFIFPDEQLRTFWMKNTYIDLSIAYFDKKKKLINTIDMKATKPEGETNYPIYPSEKPAKYALEVPKGWFLKHKIKPGDKLVLESLD